MKARFEETLQKRDADKLPMASEQALKKVNNLHSTLFGTEPEEEEPKAPEPEPKPERKAPKPMAQNRRSQRSLFQCTDCSTKRTKRESILL